MCTRQQTYHCQLFFQTCSPGGAAVEGRVDGRVRRGVDVLVGQLGVNVGEVAGGDAADGGSEVKVNAANQVEARNYLALHRQRRCLEGGRTTGSCRRILA